MHEQWVLKFWQRVQKAEAPKACWTWTGSRLPKGYGRFYPASRVGLYAHRVSWEIANGREVPPGLEVMHSCDNPPCVNPAHLSLGTHGDNTQDSIAKGRAGHGRLPGEQNPGHKLSADQVAEIRQRVRDGAVQRTLAREFEVTKETINNLVRGRTWKETNPQV